MIVSQIVISQIYGMLQENMMLKCHINDLKISAGRICEEEGLRYIESVISRFDVYERSTYVDLYKVCSKHTDETSLLLRKLKPEMYEITPQLVEVIATAVERSSGSNG